MPSLVLNTGRTRRPLPLRRSVNNIVCEPLDNFGELDRTAIR